MLHIGRQETAAVGKAKAFDLSGRVDVPVFEQDRITSTIGDLEIITLAGHCEAAGENPGTKLYFVDTAGIGERIVAIAQFEDITVIAQATVELVGAGSTGQYIIITATQQDVITRQPIEPINDRCTFQYITRIRPIDIETALYQRLVTEGDTVIEVEGVDISYAAQHIGLVEVFQMNLQTVIRKGQHQRAERQPYTAARVTSPER